MLAAARLVSYVVEIYIIFVFVWVLGSWFPTWRHQSWFRIVNSLVEPYIDLFRALPLRMGMIDFTPMVAILVLIVFRHLVWAAAQGGLH